MMVNQTGEVKSYDDYYPFGMTMSGRSSVTIEPKYRFTGKEMSEATRHYLFGARTYNSLIGKWDQVDPLNDIYVDVSPYNYCHNDPINRIDDDGRGDSLRTYILGTVTVFPKGGILEQLIPPPIGVGDPSYGRGVQQISVAMNNFGQKLDALRVSIGVAALLTINKLFSNESDSEQKSGEENTSGGREYSNHAKERMKEANISKERVEEAIQKGRTQPGNNAGETEHYLPGNQSTSGRGIRVVTNDSNGKVITVTDKGTKWKGGHLWK